MAQSVEMQQRIALWRQQAANGTLTDDQMREAVVLLREDRIGAQIASTKSKAKKAPAATPDAAGMMDEIMGGEE